MTPVKVLAIPRDPTPYQELLYQALRRRGAAVRYAGTLTGSRSVNLLALPLELLVMRLRGYRIFHLHWTFGFIFPIPIAQAKRISRAWFTVVLHMARSLGFGVVWTAHNVLPHDPVFDDDVKARRTLVGCSDLVIAHSASAIDGLAALGARPSSTAIIPHGPISPPELQRLPPPEAGQPRTIAFVGRIAPYKGLEDLVAALEGLEAPLRIVVAGACADPELIDRLMRAAAELEPVLELSLGYVPDSELIRLLGCADALVFPFRTITTSSSVMLGLAAGRAVIVPDLPAFAELPDEALIRYPAGRAGLRSALSEVAQMPAEALLRRGAAARAAATRDSWEEIAARTELAFEAARQSRLERGWRRVRGVSARRRPSVADRQR
ncbi:MAG TPA: glycosyltransferase [Solirubrobacteraceae bacterium]|nr:glycosyltransferase [Solirubrobacteraceae bacterium]